MWVGIGTLVLGVLMLAFGVSFVLEANSSRNWPTAQGTVETIRVTWRNDSTSNQTIPDREYFYEIYYDYQVDGQAYSGSRYSLGDGSTASDRVYRTEEEAREAAFDAWTPAQVVAVYYDPADPASAVLNPGANTGTYVPLIFGAVLLLSGLGILWLYLRQRT
jgi:hypothetical protein